MSGFGIKLDVTGNAPDELARRALALDPARLLPVAVRAAASLVKANFIALNSDRHRPGGRNFFLACADSTHWEVVGLIGFVNVTQRGARQRLEGGVIEPTGGKHWLTIAARTESYGHRAGEFNDLHFVRLDERLGRLKFEDYAVFDYHISHEIAHRDSLVVPE